MLARWSERAEAGLVNDVLNQPPEVSVTADLDGCLAAARARAIAQLILPDDQMVAGFSCGTCGALSSKAQDCDCPDPTQDCHPVPDLLDELAGRALDGGGLVFCARGAPFTAAARLRFPISAMASRLRVRRA